MESGLGFLHGNLTDVFPWVPHWDVSLVWVPLWELFLGISMITDLVCIQGNWSGVSPLELVRDVSTAT